MAKTTDSKAKPKRTASKTKTSSSTTDSSTATLRGPVGRPNPGSRASNAGATIPIRAKHGYIELILTQAMPHLGQAGDLVKVRPGFARNYLVPQGLGTFATQNNLRMVEKHRQRLKELEEARACRPAKPGGPDRPALADDRGQCQRRRTPLRLGQRRSDCRSPSRRRASRSMPENVRIEGPLKELGLYTIKIHLAQDIASEVKLWVVPTHTEEAAG